ncbi:hypothetical protein PSEUBRA_000427 [Kalmanozyma brasiliensis GHG001]|uniref:uncharacterized protein n=1 Tax=Kalmanozyma brasiliensis (strain GHG001) TaxID=1365824 RepID=UPI002867B492|nr:uncharacterized protein PSEUBRA_000427 [Kalmanozyma brasiliensis GHG001]KAF6766808.1 hypothetical protein PSEUBRA_000427 [Kalmanozyma brasiliensis GHG001]
MVLQSQMPDTAHVGTTAPLRHFSRMNDSVASFASSSNDRYGMEETYGPRGDNTYHSQSSSSRWHQHCHYASPDSTQRPSTSRLGESSDFEDGRPSIYASRKAPASKKEPISHDSSFAHEVASSPSSSGSGLGTLRGLRRRLFNRSSSHLKPASFLSSRSHSASSDSVDAHSPPDTPSTPPLVQPVSLPNGQKDFFATLSSLPSGVVMPAEQKPDVGTSGDSAACISPQTPRGDFANNPSPRADDTFDTSSRSGLSLIGSSNQQSVLLSPSVTVASLAPPAATHREISAVIKEDGDSDFLRAVLDYSGDQNVLLSESSFIGGRADPSSTTSSPAGHTSHFASSSPNLRSPSTARFPLLRATDGRKILTQEAAKEYAERSQSRTYAAVQRKYRKGLFSNDSDSEDEYGDDDAKCADDKSEVEPAHSTPVAVQYSDETKASSPSPLSGAVAKAGASSSSKELLTASSRSPGLDSAAKRALYNCTLLKVHVHLASALAGDAEAQPLVPVIAAGESMYSNDDLSFPRSINAISKLRQHSSTNSYSRNLRIALARTEVMRKLRREKLAIAEEVEISWFQRRYGSSSIPTEQVAKALHKAQTVSPEALATPPIAAPQLPEDSSAPCDTTSRRLSGMFGMHPGQKSDRNGIVAWAHRPSFLDRRVISLPADNVAPGEVLLSGAFKLGSQPETRTSVSPALGLSFSPRIRILAGLPSTQEELRSRVTAHIRSRRIKSKRISGLFSASESDVCENLDRHALSPPHSPGDSTHASPSNKQKRLAPWLAPRSPQLLSPAFSSQSRPARSASEGPAAFSTMHQNGSASSMPEAIELKEQDSKNSSENFASGQQQALRAQKTIEEDRVRKLENEIAFLRQREMLREKEDQDRKAREEEARRIEAQRLHQKRSAALQAQSWEDNKRALQESRERRSFTRKSVLLAEPNYGAGNPLLGHNRPEPGSSPSSPSLEQGPWSKADHRNAAFLQTDPMASKSNRNLYAQPEGQRRSRTSVAQGQHLPPANSPCLPILPTAASTRVEERRSTSMASLAAPAQPTLRHHRSLAALSMTPQVAQRRVSHKPAAGQLSASTSTQQLAPPQSGTHQSSSKLHIPVSPTMLSTSPTAALMHSPLQQPYVDPRLSMSMTNLHAQAYLQAQQRAYLLPPTLAQTARVGSRSRPRMPPLVSLYGGVVPSSAQLQR